MLLNFPAYLRRILKNQIAIMEQLNMQDYEAYKKSQILNNAKNQDDQWKSIKEE